MVFSRRWSRGFRTCWSSTAEFETPCRSTRLRTLHGGLPPRAETGRKRKKRRKKKLPRGALPRRPLPHSARCLFQQCTHVHGEQSLRWCFLSYKQVCVQPLVSALNVVRTRLAPAWRPDSSCRGREAYGLVFTHNAPRRSNTRTSQISHSVVVGGRLSQDVPPEYALLLALVLGRAHAMYRCAHPSWLFQYCRTSLACAIFFFRAFLLTRQGRKSHSIPCVPGLT